MTDRIPVRFRCRQCGVQVDDVLDDLCGSCVNAAIARAKKPRKLRSEYPCRAERLRLHRLEFARLGGFERTLKSPWTEYASRSSDPGVYQPIERDRKESDGQ